MLSSRLGTATASSEEWARHSSSLFVEPAEILRDEGTSRARFLCGQVVKHTWVVGRFKPGGK